jgi:hypothetical protein
MPGTTIERATIRRADVGWMNTATLLARSFATGVGRERNEVDALEPINALFGEELSPHEGPRADGLSWCRAR